MRSRSQYSVVWRLPEQRRPHRPCHNSCALYRTFELEACFGFNKVTWSLFLADLAKQELLGVDVDAPVLFSVLWLMAMILAHAAASVLFP